MRRRIDLRWGALALLCSALAVGCDGGTGDDGAGGEGGAGGAGGQGGNDTDAGEGGSGGTPDGQCADLNAAQCARREDCVVQDGECIDQSAAGCAALGEVACTERADCAPRNDVFGEFVDCQNAADAACVVLDEARCASREDCHWNGEACEVPAGTCADQGDAAACRAAGCHWWADQCNDDPEPRRCDQPDPQSCEAANCEWTEDGCRIPGGLPDCDALAEPACRGRDECRWAVDHCEVDPTGMPCAELGMMDCAFRNECAWDAASGTCGDRPAGACDGLAEAACNARPDCQSQYESVCDGGGAAEPPPPDPNGADRAPCPPDDADCDGVVDPCVEQFVACSSRVVACEQVPVEQCDAAPGCHVEVSDECVGRPVDCGCPPDDPGCACAQPGGGAAIPCEQVRVCVADAGLACADRPVDACAIDGVCVVERVFDCDGNGLPDEVPGGGGAAFPVPPDGDQCPSIDRCVDGAHPARCEDLGDPNTCMDFGCEWVVPDDCAEAPLPGGGEVPADCGFCIPDNGRPLPCEALEQFECGGREDCVYLQNPDQPEPEPCICPEGEPCVCAVPVPEGACIPRDIVPPCVLLPGDACAADPTCVLLDEELVPGVICLPVDLYCDRLDVQACGADPRCVVDVVMVCGVDCAPVEPCDPDDPKCFEGGGGGCVEECFEEDHCRALRNACEALDADACAANDGCVALTSLDGAPLGCFPRFECDGLAYELCDAHPDCEPVDRPAVEPCVCAIDPETGEEFCECREPGPICALSPELPPPPPPVEPGADGR